MSKLYEILSRDVLKQVVHCAICLENKCNKSYTKKLIVGTHTSLLKLITVYSNEIMSEYKDLLKLSSDDLQNILFILFQSLNNGMPITEEHKCRPIASSDIKKLAVLISEYIKKIVVK